MARRVLPRRRLERSAPYGNDDFSEMLGAFHVFERRLGFLESKYAVDSGFQLIGGDGAVHGFKHFDGAHVDALHADVAVKDGADVERVADSREDADQADLSTEFHRTQRVRHRADAADFEDDVRTFSA